MRKYVPSYSGTLRSHGLTLPHCISECSGIRIFGKRIKSIAFSTDAAIIKNINADAIIAVYPFTPQASISQAVINVADVPVFVGVGGGYTNGSRSVRLAMQAEHQGAYGVVVNAPMPNEVIAEINSVINAIATAVEEQSAATGEIAGNIAQASMGIAEVNENVAQSSVVVGDITRDVAEQNYTGYETRVWMRVVVPLWNPAPAAVAAKY